MIMSKYNSAFMPDYTIIILVLSRFLVVLLSVLVWWFVF